MLPRPTLEIDSFENFRFQVFIAASGNVFQSVSVEKPVLGRGLDSLISGGTGRRASDMLTSFQAKRTRIAPGLKAFLHGSNRSSTPPATTPPRPAEQTPTPTTPARSPNPLRVKRSQRPKPAPAPVPITSGYRPTRPPRATGSSPAEKKNLPDTGTGAVHSSAEPAFQKPVVRQRPNYLKSGPAPEPPPESITSPGLRLSLFIIDWFLMLVGFMLVWHATPPVSWLTVSLASLAVLAGAALGTWAMLPETPKPPGNCQG
jgi:hypothetical protein